MVKKRDWRGLWLGLVALLSVLLTVLFFLPASWIGLILEKQTGGRVSLGDIQGSFWHGSAFVGVASGQNGPVTPLFPGRFTWTISPVILLGQVAVKIENEKVLTPALEVSGNFSQWHIGGSSLALASERLEGLGAPLNTIGPSGKVLLRWSELEVSREGSKVALNGNMRLEMNEMSARASSIKPLGSYHMAFQWHGESADLALSTTRGPMMLEGKGVLNQGRLQFSGKAYAEAGQEEKLANLLNLLGRRRQEGDKQYIALDYR